MQRQLFCGHTQRTAISAASTLIASRSSSARHNNHIAPVIVNLMVCLSLWGWCSETIISFKDRAGCTTMAKGCCFSCTLDCSGRREKQHMLESICKQHETGPHHQDRSYTLLSLFLYLSPKWEMSFAAKFYLKKMMKSLFFYCPYLCLWED